MTPWGEVTQAAVKEALIVALKWISIERTNEDNGTDANSYLDGMIKKYSEVLELIQQEEGRE